MQTVEKSRLPEKPYPDMNFTNCVTFLAGAFLASREWKVDLAG